MLLQVEFGGQPKFNDEIDSHDRNQGPVLAIKPEIDAWAGGSSSSVMFFNPPTSHGHIQGSMLALKPEVVSTRM